MKAVVYQGPRDVAVTDVPDAKIERPTDVLVKVTTTNICGSDLHMYEGRTSFEEGRTFGHENMGEVVEIGKGVEKVQVGDRVVLPFNISCGFCKNCERGLTNYCLTTQPDPSAAGAAYGFAEMGPYGGGQAELLRVPFGDHNALRLGEVEGTAALAERLCDGLAEQLEPCTALRDVALALAQTKPERVGAGANRLARAGLVTAAIDAVSLALALPAGDGTRRRLQALGLTLAADVDAPPLQRREVPALTPRERAVAELAANRHRTREIAAQLGVSARTVENQLHSAYRKLGVASRDDLRAALTEVGLLTGEPPGTQPFAATP